MKPMTLNATTRQDQFDAMLEHSRQAEESVSRWLKTRGCGVIPSYDYNGKDKEKSPRLSMLKDRYVIPDLDVAKEGQRYWIEVKRYTHRPLNKRYGIYVHGIPERLYRDYLEVQRITGTPVYLAIEDKEYDALLIAKLDSLTPYPCQCRGCANKTGCNATFKGSIKNGVYFDVSEFAVHKSTL